MVSEFVTGLGLFKSMMDTAKGLKDVHDSTIRNTVAIELQEKILAAQEQQTALVQRVGDLEAQVAGFETWEAEKQRYRLNSLPPGVNIYTLKEGMENGEPPHHLCQTCYQHGQKSILHQSETRDGVYNLTCNECGAQHKVGHWNPPRVQYGRRSV